MIAWTSASAGACGNICVKESGNTGLVTQVEEQSRGYLKTIGRSLLPTTTTGFPALTDSPRFSLSSPGVLSHYLLQHLALQLNLLTTTAD